MHSGPPTASARRQLNAAPTTTGSSWVWGYRLMQTTATQAACNRAASKPLARPPSRASRWRTSQARTSPTRRSSTISNCTRRRTSWPTQHWTPSASYPSCKNWTRGPQRKNLERLSTTSRPEKPWRRRHTWINDQGRERRTDWRPTRAALPVLEGELCTTRHTRRQEIATLFKNKGDRTNCNSHQGISLLSIVGKVFARVILTRLQVLASRVYSKSQCGFRAGRSCRRSARSRISRSSLPS